MCISMITPHCEHAWKLTLAAGQSLTGRQRASGTARRFGDIEKAGKDS